MTFENFNNNQPKKVGDAEAKFNELMKEALREGVAEPLEENEDDTVNLNSAISLIKNLKTSFENDGYLTDEQTEETLSMIKNLEELQNELPNNQQIKIALVQLREIHRSSMEETV